jgi:hypothetical protein
MLLYSGKLPEDLQAHLPLSHACPFALFMKERTR